MSDNTISPKARPKHRKAFWIAFAALFAVQVFAIQTRNETIAKCVSDGYTQASCSGFSEHPLVPLMSLALGVMLIYAIGAGIWRWSKNR